MVTLVNRAKMSTSTTGTGTITLGSAETGYQTFADAGVANGDVVRYVIEDGNDWEIGSGTYTATGTTLSRTVSESSNADAALNLSGSAVVFITAAAGDVFQGELFAESYDGTSTKPTASGTNTIAIGVNAYAVNEYSIAIGRNASAQGGSQAIALGEGADARQVAAVAIGLDSYANGSASVALGRDAQAISGSNATAISKSYASGASSLAAAIANNTSSYGATGSNSIAIGYLSKAEDTYAIALSGGRADGSASLAWSTNARARFSRSIALGYNAFSNADDAIAIGDNALSAVKGKVAYASGRFAAQGDAQGGQFIFRADTTDATAEALTTNNSTASTTNQIILPNNSAYSFSGTIIARQQASGGSNYASWEIKGALLRDATAASTVLGNGIVNKLYATAGASAWAVALTADTTNGGLKVEVTGAAATNIRWVATVNTSEVTYA